MSRLVPTDQCLDFELYQKDTHKGRFRWILRILRDGTDKADLQITRVLEPIGYEGEYVTHWKTGHKFKRKGQKIRGYRAEARTDKKAHGWKTNDLAYDSRDWEP